MPVDALESLVERELRRPRLPYRTPAWIAREDPLADPDDYMPDPRTVEPYDSDIAGENE